jgi:hypothetical protein
MRSALEDFGTISLATKDVDVYGSDEIDWGTIDARFRSPQHLTGNHGDGCVVFNAPADFNAADDFIPFIVDGTATGPTTKILTGPQVGALLGTYPKKGIAWVLPLPKVHRRFMRAGCTPKSSGTLTACTLKAYNEYGPNIGLGIL